MVEVIFGATVACSNGYTTASAEMICEMGPRWAGVVCTETTGSFSFSSLAQPPALQSIAAIAPKRASRLQKDIKEGFMVGFMASSAPRTGFANWREPGDTGRSRPDR